MKKILFGVAPIAAVLAVALALLGASVTTTSAVVNSAAAVPTIVDGGNTPLATAASRTSTITADADEGAGNLRLVATTGTLTNHRASAVLAGVVTGNNTNDATVIDAAATGVLAAGTVDTDGDGAAGPACTDCLQAALYTGGFASVLAAGTVDDNNDGVADPGALANVVIAGDQMDQLAGGVLDSDEDAAAGPAIAFAGKNLDTVQSDWTSPAVGPGTADITLIQGASIRTVTITYRGGISAVALASRIQTAAAVVTAAAAENIRSTTATAPVGPLNALAANLRTTVSDSAGNGLNGVTVSYINTDGGLFDTATLAVATGAATTATVGTTRGIANTVSLTAGATGATGDKATVTANAGGVTATDELTFAGNAVTCTVTTAQTSVNAGGSTQVTAQFWSVAPAADGTGGVPIPDYTAILGAGAAAGDPTILAVNAVGAGTFAITGLNAPVGGAMNATLTVGASGGTGVLATMGGTSVTCNTTVVVGTAVAPPTPGAPGDGTIVGSTPPAGGFGLVTFGGTIEQLDAAMATAGCDRIFATSAGSFIVYIPSTAIGAVNAPFLALATDGAFAAGTPMLLGGCA